MTITLTGWQQAVFDAVTYKPTPTHFVQPRERVGAYPAARELRGILDGLEQLGLVRHVPDHGWVRALNITWSWPESWPAEAQRFA